MGYSEGILIMARSVMRRRVRIVMSSRAQAVTAEAHEAQQQDDKERKEFHARQSLRGEGAERQ